MEKSPKGLPFHENKYEDHGVPWIAKELDFLLLNLNVAQDALLFQQELGSMLEFLLKRADDSIFEKWLKDDKFIDWFQERIQGVSP